MLEHVKPVSIWKIFLTVLCYAYEFCVKQRRRGADDQQIKTNKFSSSLQVQIETGPVKKFKEIVEINIDPHKFLDNFRLMKKYLEECQCHHITTYGN